MTPQKDLFQDLWVVFVRDPDMNIHGFEFTTLEGFNSFLDTVRELGWDFITSHVLREKKQ